MRTLKKRTPGRYERFSLPITLEIGILMLRMFEIAETCEKRTRTALNGHIPCELRTLKAKQSFRLTRPYC